MDLLKIVEILDLNHFYRSNLRTSYLITTLKEDPLISFYIIGTYLKHSSKPYLPENRNYLEMSKAERYSFEFQQYVEWTLDIKHNVTENPNIVSEGSKRKTAKFLIHNFKEAYKKWYDYLYVRYFDRAEKTVTLLTKINQGNELDDKDIKYATKLNEKRKFNLIKLASFFEYMINTANEDLNMPVTDSTIYKMRRRIYFNFNQYWNKHYDEATGKLKIENNKDFCISKQEVLDYQEKQEQKRLEREQNKIN